jgi:hypothetical protein
METDTISHSVPWKLFGLMGATVALFVGAGIAHAAPLNFLTSESITLSSYPTTLTIATGSVADALGVNATSVWVMLSNTTGGSFTLLSPSYDLSVATSRGGGNATVSCSGGTEMATLSQTTGSTVYTVTPTTQNCANASAPIITVSPTSTNITSNSAMITWTTNIPADSTVYYGTTTSYGATSTVPTLVTTHSITLTGLSAATLYNYEVTSAEYGTSTTSGDYTFTTASTPSVSSGSSVTVGVAAGGVYIPIANQLPPVSTSTPPSSVTPPLSTSGMTISQMQALLASLESELQALEAQAGNQTGSSTVSFVFTRDLQSGMTGNDVKQLQLFLIAENAGLAARKLKAHGVTTTFAALTKNALIEFQKSVGIKPASGYFGPITRKWVKGHE